VICTGFIAFDEQVVRSSPANLSWAVLMLVLVIALLGMFFIGVVLLTIARRLRDRKPAAEQDQSSQKKSDLDDRDPWREAGKRLDSQDQG
jgi:hypothetical protein